MFALTDGYGVDVAVEAVGMPDHLRHVHPDRAPRRQVANVGVHGKPVQLDLQDLWIKNINISMGLVNTTTSRCC